MILAIYLLGVLVSSVLTYIFVRTYMRPYKGGDILAFIGASLASWIWLPFLTVLFLKFRLPKSSRNFNKISEKFFTIGKKGIK